MGVLFKRDEGRLLTKKSKLSSSSSYDCFFCAFSSTSAWVVIAFVVGNEQEKKTFACILYDVKKKYHTKRIVIYITFRIVYILEFRSPIKSWNATTSICQKRGA